MTEQHALFVDPHWTENWSEGDKVVSQYTKNEGVITDVVTGRHLLIRWSSWLNEPDGYIARHSSELGLVKA